jgi:uncharacterized protein YbaR (Trm112 family)/SAM-dependent methyltransferase
MKERILEFLACPDCGSSFVLKHPQIKNKEIKKGILICRNQHAYPIIDFIPRLLNAQKIKITAGKQQVRKSFSAKWTTWTKFNPWFVNFFDEWFQRKLGLKDKKEFLNYFKDKKYLLDAGTGIGTKVETMCRLSRGEVFGVDISESVLTAYRNTRKYSNAHIIQADLFHLPFKKKFFNFIVCDGVLHHTPSARQSFFSLCRHLDSGGIIDIHVYKKMGPMREFTDDFIRQVSTRIDFKQCYKFCEDFTRFGQYFSRLKAEVNIPVDIPVLGIKKGTYDMQRFIYYNIFQCFWNENLSFKENNLVNLDWFHPVYASRHTEQEVLGWFRQARLKQIKSFKTNESGVSVKGVKK